MIFFKLYVVRYEMGGFGFLFSNVSKYCKLSSCGAFGLVVFFSFVLIAFCDAAAFTEKWKKCVFEFLIESPINENIYGRIDDSKNSGCWMYVQIIGPPKQHIILQI